MNKKGLSLLEVLISTVLMALLVTGLINVVVSSRAWILHNRSRATAIQLGKSFLIPLYKDVKVVEWNNNANCLNGLAASCPGPQQVPIGDGLFYTPTYTYPDNPVIPDIGPSANPMGRLRKVVVTINWQGNEFE